jgi:hypothetical protein
MNSAPQNPTFRRTFFRKRGDNRFEAMQWTQGPGLSTRASTISADPSAAGFRRYSSVLDLEPHAGEIFGDVPQPLRDVLIV